jgi:hypothetical protein
MISVANNLHAVFVITLGQGWQIFSLLSAKNTSQVTYQYEVVPVPVLLDSMRYLLLHILGTY